MLRGSGPTKTQRVNTDINVQNVSARPNNHAASSFIPPEALCRGDRLMPCVAADVGFGQRAQWAKRAAHHRHRHRRQAPPQARSRSVDAVDASSRAYHSWRPRMFGCCMYGGNARRVEGRCLKIDSSQAVWCVGRSDAGARVAC